VFENFAVGIEAEDIDTGGFLTKQAQVTHMDKGQVAIDSDAFYLAGDAPGLVEEVHHTVNAIGDERVVLDVRPGHESRIQIRPTLVEDLAVDDVDYSFDVVSCHDSALALWFGIDAGLNNGSAIPAPRASTRPLIGSTGLSLAAVQFQPQYSNHPFSSRFFSSAKGE
jgi:hypothetical protein